MAFNFLSSIVNNQTMNDDLGSSVDGEIEADDESDVEIDFEDEEETLDLEDGNSSDLDNDRDEGRPGDRQRNDSPDGVEWGNELHDVEIDLFTQHPGPKLVDTDLTFESKPIQFVDLFLPQCFYDLCAEQSNLYARQKNAPRSFREIDSQDIRTFLYVNMMFGIHKLPYYRLYWSQDPLLRVSAVADVISRTRYEEICRYLHLTDSTKAIPRGQPGFDPLYKFRPLLDLVRTASQNYYYPGAALSFDEAMIPFTGRLYFKQYIKGKPNPLGVKVWCCAEPSTGYLCNFSFYTGKEDFPTDKGLGHHVVWSLGERYLDRNHHFYFDNFFTSVKLEQDLLERSTYSCGTIRTNRKFWPVDLKRVVLNNGEIKFRQTGNLLACVWKDKRQISILSTNSSPTVDSIQRRVRGGIVTKEVPSAVANYNANMGGVDLNDQLRTYYSIGRKSVKWWRCCFFYLLEVAVLNAYIIYKKMPRPPNVKPLDHFSFHLEVARSLMTPTRKRNVSEQPTIGGIATPDMTKHKLVRLPGRKKQCYNCRKENRRTEAGKRPETVYGCSLCLTHLCDELCFVKFHQDISN